MKVPQGWSIQPLSDIARVTSGGTPSRAKPEYWEGGNVPWIRTTEVQNCHLFPEDTQEYISELGVANSSAKLVPAGTLLLAMIGQGKTRGQIALLKFEATTNQNCAAIILNKESYPEYYFNFLLSKYKNIRGMSNSAGQSNLSGALVKAIQVPVPPYSEQRKIATILSTWDEAIATTEKLLANSEQQKKSLMQQLLTGRRRLPGFEKDWKEKKVSEFLVESRNPSKEIDPSKRLTVRLNLNGVEKRDVRGTESKDSTAHFIRRAGQFIYGKQNIHKGSFGIIPEIYDGFETSQDLPAFDFTKDCDPDWFLFVFSRPNFYQALESKMSGTGSKRLKPKDLYRVSILAPEINEQKAIGQALLIADLEVQSLRSSIVHLKQEKKALMQQLLTGKRRVKVDEEQSDAVPA